MIKRITNTGIVKLCEITSKEPVIYSPPGILTLIIYHLNYYSKRLLLLLFINIPITTQAIIMTTTAITDSGELIAKSPKSLLKEPAIFGITIAESKK